MTVSSTLSSGSALAHPLQGQRPIQYAQYSVSGTTKLHGEFGRGSPPLVRQSGGGHNGRSFCDLSFSPLHATFPRTTAKCR